MLKEIISGNPDTKEKDRILLGILAFEIQRFKKYSTLFMRAKGFLLFRS